MKSGLSLYLDLLRVLAALQVVLYHLGWLQTGGIGQHFWNRWGHEAVVIFFVLSGFVIRHALDVKDHTVSDYIASRVSRLYSVALPCIVLTFVFDAIGGQLAPDLYRNVGLHDTLALALTRLLFSLTMFNQSWLSVSLGSNTPFWSLCYEFWYYVLFAAGFYSTGWRRLGLLVVLALAAGPHVMLLFPVWLLGIVAYKECYSRDWSRPVVWLAYAQFGAAIGCHVYWDLPTVGAELLQTIITRNVNWSEFAFSDTLLGLSFALHLMAAKQLDQPLLRALGGIAGLVRAIAARSFTLYLIHMPLMMLLTSMSLAYGWAEASSWMIGIGTIMIPLALAPTIENQRHGLRLWLLQWPPRRAPRIGVELAV